MSDEKDPFAKPPAWWIEAQNQERLQRERERSQQRVFEYFELQRKEWDAELRAKRQAEANQNQGQPAIARCGTAREAIIKAIDILEIELGRKPDRSEVYNYLADGMDTCKVFIRSDREIGLSWWNDRGEDELMNRKAFSKRYKRLTEGQ